MARESARLWEDHYGRALKENPLQGVRALLAYNSVIDRVRSLDETLLQSLPPPTAVPPLFAKAAEGLEDLAEGLSYSITNGLALEVLCAPAVIRFLESLGGYEDRLGGQAATVARLLSDFAATRILVHPDRFNDQLAALYRGSRAEVPLQLGELLEHVEASELSWECEPEVHFILEYPAGLAFGGAPSPRANRFIAAPQTAIHFHTEWEGALSTIARHCDGFFIAGLNHMGEDYEESFHRVQEHIRTAKAANPALVVHVEITSVPDLRKRGAIVDDILPLVDSVGVNEAELADLAFLLGLPKWEEVRRRAPSQLEALQLLQALGVRRVHLHTLGYYLALSPNPPTAVRRSLLSAALIAAARATSGRSPKPEELAAMGTVPVALNGLSALDDLAKGLRLKGADRRTLTEQGWFEAENLVAVPTKVVESPQYTVGLGDLISGGAFFGERWGTGPPQS